MTLSLLNLCRLSGLSDYKFCYHESLPVAGNCRICLIELEDIDKQIAACVTNVETNYAIWTENIFCKKARENVIEILLINHPLDCPICDQGGECDLQDHVKSVGNFKNRFYFNKNCIKDKCAGIFIKTIMTRCINCLRCVRFNKLVGQHFFGVINRTNRSEIVYHSFDNDSFEFSGTTIDLCPVGALTGRQYAFKYRPWEIKIVESIDTTDGLGSSIYVSYKDNEVIKISVKSNFYLNGSIISDRIRFSYDSNNNNRLKLIYFYNEITKCYEKINWNFLLSKFENLIKSNKIYFIINNELDTETIFYLKNICYKNKMMFSLKVDKNNTNNFYIHTTKKFVKILDYGSELCYLLGINPAIECLLLNLKLRMKYRKAILSIFCIGGSFNNKYMLKIVGLKIKHLINVFHGKNKVLSKYFLSVYNSLFIIGESLIKTLISVENILLQLQTKIKKVNFFKIYLKSNTISTQMANIKGIYKKNSDAFYFFFNIDETINIRKMFLNTKNIVWFTSFKPKKFLMYKYLIPVGTFLENENYYINMEQKIQKSQNIGFSVKSIISIFKAFFNDETNKNTFGFNYLNYLFEFATEFRIFGNVRNYLNEFGGDIFLQFHYIKFSIVKNLIKSLCSNVWAKNSINILEAHHQFIVKKMINFPLNVSVRY